jgi:hypothetical protein
MTALAARIDVAGFRDGRPLVIAQSGSFTLGDLAPLIPPRMCEGKATPFPLLSPLPSGLQLNSFARFWRWTVLPPAFCCWLLRFPGKRYRR